MERKNLSQLLEDGLYTMHLRDLNQLAGKLEANRCEGSQYASDARERTPYEQRVVDVWFDRNRQQLTEENQVEFLKDLHGEPNDFDPYAPL